MARQFGLTSLRVNLTLAGTAQRISATALPVVGFEIYAVSGNVGDIYVGGSTVDNTMRVLAPGQSWSPSDMNLHGTSGMYDLTEVYFDGANTNDDIVVTYTSLVGGA